MSNAQKRCNSITKASTCRSHPFQIQQTATNTPLTNIHNSRHSTTLSTPRSASSKNTHLRLASGQKLEESSSNGSESRYQCRYQRSSSPSTPVASTPLAPTYSVLCSRDTSTPPQHRCENPPNSDIATLWPEVFWKISQPHMQPSNSVYSISESEMALRNINIQDGKAYDLSNGRRVEDECPHLKVETVKLKKSTVLSCVHAKEIAEVNGNTNEKTNDAARMQFQNQFVPYLHINALPIDESSQDTTPQQEESATALYQDHQNQPQSAHEEKQQSHRASRRDLLPNSAPSHPGTAPPPSPCQMVVFPISMTLTNTIQKQDEVFTILFGLSTTDSLRYIYPYQLKSLNLPGWITAERQCACFLGVFFGVKNLQQWNEYASRTLRGLLTSQRADKNEDKKAAAGALHCYGYLVQGPQSKIVEMSCNIQQYESTTRTRSESHVTRGLFTKPHEKALKRALSKSNQRTDRSNKTGNASDGTLQSVVFNPSFEVRHLCTLDLAKATDVLRFNEYHQAILKWGLAEHGFSYAKNLHGVLWGKESRDPEPMSDGDARDYWKEVLVYQKEGSEAV